MSKKKVNVSKIYHPGYDESTIGKKQPRIDMPEKQQNAAHSNVIWSDSDKANHPGFSD